MGVLTDNSFTEQRARRTKRHFDALCEDQRLQNTEEHFRGTVFYTRLLLQPHNSRHRFTGMSKIAKGFRFFEPARPVIIVPITQKENKQGSITGLSELLEPIWSTTPLLPSFPDVATAFELLLTIPVTGFCWEIIFKTSMNQQLQLKHQAVSTQYRKQSGPQPGPTGRD